MLMLALPFVILALGSGKAEGLIWLMFPIVLALPALALLALVFAPVEALAVAGGLSKNRTVIVAGALGGAFIWLSMVGLQAAAQGKPVLSVLGSTVAIRTTFIWMAMGAVLGCLWRASEWLARSFGWLGHG